MATNPATTPAKKCTTMPNHTAPVKLNSLDEIPLSSKSSLNPDTKQENRRRGYTYVSTDQELLDAWQWSVLHTNVAVLGPW